MNLEEIYSKIILVLVSGLVGGLLVYLGSFFKTDKNEMRKFRTDLKDVLDMISIGNITEPGTRNTIRDKLFDLDNFVKVGFPSYIKKYLDEVREKFGELDLNCTFFYRAKNESDRLEYLSKIETILLSLMHKRNDLEKLCGIDFISILRNRLSQLVAWTSKKIRNKK